MLLSMTTYLIILICLEGVLLALAVKILRHSIPRMVDASNTSELILDCEYVYDANDLKLVVKWFHNNMPEPIYQWIPDLDIRYVSQLLKPRLDMNYTVNRNDKYSKYRALKIRNNITVDLNGNFSCIVSSLAGQDTRQGQMVVYVPPLIFDFNYTEIQNTGDYELECQAKGVFPRPLLTLSEQTTHGSNFHTFPKVNLTIEQNRATSFYDTSIKHIPQSSSTGAIYECKIEIPSTNYMRKKKILMRPARYISDGTQQLLSAQRFLSALIILWHLFLY